jgi:hypothetical protein
LALSAVRTGWSRLASSVISVSSAMPFSGTPKTRQIRLIVSSNTIPAMTAASFFAVVPEVLGTVIQEVIEADGDCVVLDCREQSARYLLKHVLQEGSHLREQRAKCASTRKSTDNALSMYTVQIGT